LVEIGKVNNLEVVKEVEFGLYLDGGEVFGEILLPIRYVPRDCKLGDRIDVFIYFDSEDRIIATTEKPRAQVGQFALLKVVSVNSIGAFLDWGLPKDLLLPFNEQKRRLHPGEWRTVRVYQDVRTLRLVASTKLDKFLDKTPPAYEIGGEVELYIFERTDLGFNAIVNNAHWGLLLDNEVYKPLTGGEKVTGYIKYIHEDGKIDLSLQKPGYEKVVDISEELLKMLKAQGGFLPLTDKSSPKLIHSLLGVSKKTFKKAIGGLYRKRLIAIEAGGIRLMAPAGK